MRTSIAGAFLLEAGDGSDIILWKCNDAPAFHWVHLPLLLERLPFSSFRWQMMVAKQAPPGVSNAAVSCQEVDGEFIKYKAKPNYVMSVC